MAAGTASMGNREALGAGAAVPGHEPSRRVFDSLEKQHDYAVEEIDGRGTLLDAVDALEASARADRTVSAAIRRSEDG